MQDPGNIKFFRYGLKPTSHSEQTQGIQELIESSIRYRIKAQK